MPKVSIIVPVYNTEKYLATCLDTMLNQALYDIEIVLIDDGSRDNSGKICDKFAEKDNRVKVIHQANAGVGKARNAGMKAAKGEYIFFVDSDDTVGKNLFADLYNTAKKHNADAVFFGFTRCKDSIPSENDYKQFPPFDGVIEKKELIEKVNFLASKVRLLFVKNEIVKKHNLQFEKIRIGEDVLFNLEVLNAVETRIAATKNAEYYYYLRDGSAMGTYSDDVFSGLYKLAHRAEEISVETMNKPELAKKWYLIAISATLGIMANSTCTLTTKEKLERFKNMMKDEKIANAVDTADLNDYKGRLTHVKLWLLKHRCYRAVLFLGELKRRHMAE